MVFQLDNEFLKIFIAYSNLCSYETVGKNSWQYRENSVISSPDGDLLLAARPEETLLIADIIPSDFGSTHPEGDYLKDRRPELYYALIVKSAAFEGGYTYPDKPA